MTLVRDSGRAGRGKGGGRGGEGERLTYDAYSNVCLWSRGWVRVEVLEVLSTTCFSYRVDRVLNVRNHIVSFQSLAGKSGTKINIV